MRIQTICNIKWLGKMPCIQFIFYILRHSHNLPMNILLILLICFSSQTYDYIYFYCLQKHMYLIRIVFFVVIYKVPGTHIVILTVRTKFLFALHIPPKIMKPELMIKFLRTENNIYSLVDAFRHVLDPPRHMNIPFQEPCVILSYEK